MKVLHIIPDLDYGNAARQLSWLAPVVKQSAVDCRVCVLSGRGPLAKSLANVPLDYLHWNRWVDLKPFWRLHEVLTTFQPDVIHCWQQESVRALALVRYPNNRKSVGRAAAPFWMPWSPHPPSRRRVSNSLRCP